LILTLANMGMGHYSRAWSLIGQAARAAIDLNLDRPMDLVSNSTKARSRSKHVFLGCFVLDTLVAARLKRRPHLRTDDIDAIGLVEEDGLEEWDPWTDCLTVRRGSSGSSRVPASILSTFNRLIQVLKSLNDATCVPAGADCMQASATLLETLQTWSQSQPRSFLDSLSSNSEHSPSLLPHQNHLYNIYFTTLAASQLLSRGNEYEALDLEPCTRSAKHVVGLINQHSNNFGLLIVPPTYEYFVKTAYDVVHAVQSSIESTHIILNDWKRNLDHCLDAMEPAWPVFESFKTSITYQSTSEARRQSQVAFDLISGISQDTDTPMSGGKTPQSMASYETMSSQSPQIFRTMARPETSQQQRTSMQSLKAQEPRTSSFGQSSGHGLPQNPLNIYENAHAPYLQNKRPSTGTDKPSVPVTSLQSQASFNIAPPNNPQLHRSLTMSSADVEFDPMFNELMRLDATEWYVPRFYPMSHN
jgi:Fungal specific transcription factor domain